MTEHSIVSKLFRKSVNERLKRLEQKAQQAKTACIISSKEFNILKEDIEELYSKDSTKMKRLNKLEKRMCK